MIQIDMVASVREKGGKGAARSLRRVGQIPAVLYGPKTEPVSLSMDRASLTKSLIGLQGQNAVINLAVDGGANHPVLVRDLQVDPISDDLLHADFLEVSLDQARVFSVPVRFTGKSKGVELGGRTKVIQAKVKLKGAPLDVPDFVEADVTNLNINENLTAASVQVPANTSLEEKEKMVLMTILPAKKKV